MHIQLPKIEVDLHTPLPIMPTPTIRYLMACPVLAKLPGLLFYIMSSYEKINTSPCLYSHSGNGCFLISNIMQNNTVVPGGAGTYLFISYRPVTQPQSLYQLCRAIRASLCSLFPLRLFSSFIKIS